MLFLFNEVLKKEEEERKAKEGSTRKVVKTGESLIKMSWWLPCYTYETNGYTTPFIYN